MPRKRAPIVPSPAPVVGPPPLAPAAAAYLAQVEARRKAALSAISNLPIAALVWGPDPNGPSPVASVRRLLRDTLIKNGHVAHFSEELIDPKSKHSAFAQQMSHAEGYDVVFSVPETPGSIAEIHDFARLPKISEKIITFLDRRWNNGYANRALLELRSIATCDVELYDHKTLPNCIVDKALVVIHRLQEFQYALGRRA